MATKRAPPRLGRGLAALLGDPIDSPAAGPHGGLQTLPLDLLEPNPFQPRTTVDAQALRELAESIKARGLLQPLLARPHPKNEGHFQIIAGERRWRAAAMVGLHDVPAVVRTMSDTEAATAALVENLQREDLNPMEEAEGYSRLVDELGITQEELAQSLGKSRAHITNVLRLLNLPEVVQQEVRKGALTFGHARALLSHPDPEAALEVVLNRHMTVRDTEALASKAKPPQAKPRARQASRDVVAYEGMLTEALGSRVRINLSSGGGGSLTLQFNSLDQLDDWAARLTRAAR